MENAKEEHYLIKIKHHGFDESSMFVTDWDTMR